MKPGKRNLLLEIEYDGSNYCGWQIQSRQLPVCGLRPEKRSVQETLQKALNKILREKVKLIGSGRTDAGVHAAKQFANFISNSTLDLDKLNGSLNALLPDDISVNSVKRVSPDFHSRFNVKSKVYRYTIINRRQRPAIMRDYAYFCRYPLNIGLIRREAKAVLGRHNFSAFCASAGKKKNPLKRIKSLKIKKENDFIYIEIEADSFLYNMARNIVGTLIEIGRGRFGAGTMKKILVSKDRKLAGPTAPAKGLCLLEVKY